MQLIYHQIQILLTLGLTHLRTMGFGIDMAKAKVIHQEKIRKARRKLLPQLYIDFIKSQETSADTSAIVAKKQALRDYPAQAGISTAQNVTDLKANWDTSVLGKSPYSS